MAEAQVPHKLLAAPASLPTHQNPSTTSLIDANLTLDADMYVSLTKTLVFNRTSSPPASQSPEINHDPLQIQYIPRMVRILGTVRRASNSSASVRVLRARTLPVPVSPLTPYGRSSLYQRTFLPLSPQLFTCSRKCSGLRKLYSGYEQIAVLAS